MKINTKKKRNIRGLLCVENGEGKFEAINNDYTIEVHFEKEEEQKEFVKMMKELYEHPDKLFSINMDCLNSNLEARGGDSIKVSWKNGNYPGREFFYGIRKEGFDEDMDDWILIDEKEPPENEYILISMSNYVLPIIGRYEDGAFYNGDEEKSLESYGLFINAWMPLPKPYREDYEVEG